MAGAVRQCMEELEDSLGFYSLRMEWWKRVCTHNPLERFIRWLRVRLSPIGCFHGKSTVERAVFKQLGRWARARFSGDRRYDCPGLFSSLFWDFLLEMKSGFQYN